MKRMIFLLMIILLCAFTKKVDEIDIYYEGEERQKITFESDGCITKSGIF